MRRHDNHSKSTDPLNIHTCIALQHSPRHLARPVPAPNTPYPLPACLPYQPRCHFWLSAPSYVCWWFTLSSKVACHPIMACASSSHINPLGATTAWCDVVSWHELSLLHPHAAALLAFSATRLTASFASACQPRKLPYLGTTRMSRNNRGRAISGHGMGRRACFSNARDWPPVFFFPTTHTHTHTLP